MNKQIFLIALAMVTLTASGQKKPKIEGNREVSEFYKDIPFEFNAVEINDDLEISLRQGSSNSYRLNADSNLHTVVQFVVIDSILKVFTTDRITGSKKLEISLTVQQIEHLIVKQDSEVKSVGVLTADKFYLSGYDGAKMDLDIKAADVTTIMHRNSGGKVRVDSENSTLIMNDRTDLKANVIANMVRVTLNNTADLDLEGDADYAVFNLKKSSTLNARKMKVSSADLYTSNSSDVYINASKSIEVYAQGKSNVYVYGNPNVEIKGLTDKSKIIKKK